MLTELGFHNALGPLENERWPCWVDTQAKIENHNKINMLRHLFEHYGQDPSDLVFFLNEKRDDDEESSQRHKNPQSVLDTGFTEPPGSDRIVQVCVTHEEQLSLRFYE